MIVKKKVPPFNTKIYCQICRSSLPFSYCNLLSETKHIVKDILCTRGSDSKASACDVGDPGSIPVKIPWRRKWQSTPALFHGKSHGQRSLIDYSPWGRKELDMTERLHFHFHFPSSQLFYPVRYMKSLVVILMSFRVEGILFSFLMKHRIY